LSANACPRCGAQLAPLQAGAFTLAACRACAGVFAPSNAAAHLAQKVDEQMSAAVAQVSQGSADMSAMPDAGPQLPCPVCTNPMSRVVVLETSLDTCIMHGTWFDAWELERVMRAKGAANAPAIVGTRKEFLETPPNSNGYARSAANVAASTSEGVGMAAVEVVADVAASGAAELAVEGLFAIITAIFD